MIIKKIIMPLLLVTQICYGADTDKDKLADPQQELVNALETLSRIEDHIKEDPSRLNLYSTEIAESTSTFGLTLLEIEKDLINAPKKPRTVVPQPMKKYKIPEYYLPGLKG